MRKALQIAVVVLLMVALVPLHAEAQNKKKKKKKKADDAAVTLEVMPVFETGAFQQVVDAVAEGREKGTVNPEALFVAGMALEGLKKKGEAAGSYAAIAEGRANDDAWRYVGESARALAAGDVGGAGAAIARAVELDPRNEFAHFQKGMVFAAQDQYGPAADAFTRALESDPDLAYAHYYAAMSYIQTKNLVAATNHLERFLQLAPEAPQRVQVESMLASLRRP